MSEGDVSLIQDEDVLRRMWQQTDDFSRKKEIRAHMYKLREERLRALYQGGGDDSDAVREMCSSPIPPNSPPATEKGGERRGAHSDSFADQSFQSLKSKEIRDSESPTRDYHYAVEDPDPNRGWTVVSKSGVSDDGNTQSEFTVAHKSGNEEIDGGNASFAALKESGKSVTEHEDDNSKFFSAESSDRSVANEQFVKKSDDGETYSSTTSNSVVTSNKQSSHSQKFETNQDDMGGVTIEEDCDDTASITSNRSNRNVNTTSTSNKKNISSVQNSRQISDIADEGQLISRKVQHPDEFTTVIIEERKLDDGTIVTSTSTETSGSYISKGGKDSENVMNSSKKSEKSSDHVENVRKSSTTIDKNSSTVISEANKESRQISRNKSDNIKVSQGKTVKNKQIDSIETSNAEGELISRKVQHPDEFTTVIIEERKLDDGTIVTSKSTETKGSNMTKTGKRSENVMTSSKKNEKLSDYSTTKYDKRNSTTVDEDISTTVLKRGKETVDDSRQLSKTQSDDVKISRDETITRKHVDDIETGSVVSVDSKYSENDNQPDSFETKCKKVIAYEVEKDKTDDIIRKHAEIIKKTEIVDVDKSHINITKAKDTKSLVAHTTEFIDNESRSIPDKNKDFTKEEVTVSVTKTISTVDEDTNLERDIKIKPQVKDTDDQPSDKNVQTPENPKRHEPSSDDVPREKTTGEYITTYQTDYTNKKISVDNSPTHEAFARSLRSSPDNPLSRDSPARGSNRSLKTSTTSLRSSCSPEKIYPHNFKHGSPSPSRHTSVSSISTTEKYKSKNDRNKHTEIYGYSPERRESSPEKSPVRSNKQDSRRNSKDKSQPSSPTRYVKPSTPNISPSRERTPSSSPQRKTSFKNESPRPTRKPDYRTPSTSPQRKGSLKTHKKPEHIPNASPIGSPSRTPTNRSPVRESEYSSPRYSSPSPTRKLPTNPPSIVTSDRSPTREYSPSPSDGKPKYSSRIPCRTSPSLSPSRIHGSPSYSPEREIVPTDRIQITPKSYRSRDSSPTTSVSEIEYINKDQIDKYDVTEDENKFGTYRKNKKYSEIESLDYDVNETNVREFTDIKRGEIVDDRNEIPDNNSKSVGPKEKPPFVRSETYEERCRKILGMPDKKTLVEGAQKNLTEILGKLSSESSPAPENMREPSPDKELNYNVKSAEIVDGVLIKPSSKNPDAQHLNLVDAEFINVDKHGRIVAADKTLTHDKLKKEQTTKFLDSEKTTEKDNKRASKQSSPVREMKSPDKYPHRSDSPRKNLPSDTNKSPSPVRKPSETNKSPSPVRKPSEPNKSHSPVRKPSETNKSPSPVRKLSETNVSPKMNKSPSPVRKSPSKDSTTFTKVVKISENIVDTYVKEKSTADKKFESITSKRTFTKKEPVTGRVPTDSNTTIRTSSPSTGSKEKKSPSPKLNLERKPYERKPSDITSSPKASPERKERPEKENVSRKPTSHDKVSTIRKSPSEIRKYTPGKYPVENGICSPDKTSPDRKKSYYTEPVKGQPREPSRSVSPQKKVTDVVPKYSPRLIKKSPEKTPYKTSVTDTNKVTTVQTSVNKNVTKKNEPSRTILTTTKYDIFKHDKNQGNKKTENITDRKVVKTERITSIASKFDKVKKKTTDDVIRKPYTKPSDQTVTITRTTSDITTKQNKTSPTRMRSKPEIDIKRNTFAKQVTDVDASHKYKSTTITSTTKTTSKTQNKLKVNVDDYENVIIDIQQPKSSRESSIERVWPTPVSDKDYSEKPRYPDNVTEPDDTTSNKKKHYQTIHETEPLTRITNSKIIELSDDEVDLINPNTKIHRVTDSDECLLSVNEKVSKFTNIKSDVRETETKKKYSQKRSSEENTIETSQRTAKQKDSKNTHVKEFIKHERDSGLEDDDCLLTVNEKVTHFITAAEKITQPMKLTEPASKKERPDITMVDDNLKSDNCMLSVTDKVNKFVKTTERIVSPERSPSLVSKSSKLVHDVKNKFENIENTCDLRLNIQKETTASIARKSSLTDIKHTKQPSPDRTTSPRYSVDKPMTNTSPRHSIDKPLANTSPRHSIDKSPTNTRPITTLRSSEAVKKAKALFENIATTQKAETTDIYNRKTTKLTDIGVYKKSPTAESIPDVVPKKEFDVSSAESDGEIIVTTKTVTTHGRKSKPSIYDERMSPERHTTVTTHGRKSKPSTYDERMSPERHTTVKKDLAATTAKYATEKNKEDKSYTTTVTEKYTTTEKNRNESDVYDNYASTRRGSGKFGIELRRMSTDQSHTSEKRRSSTNVESQSHTTIEDIMDIVVLEKMLEKVTGYEQRRRIRSQIRILRKNMENIERSEDVSESTTSRHTTPLKSSDTASYMQDTLCSELRKTSHTYDTEITVDRRHSKESNSKFYTEVSHSRSHSSEKKSPSVSPDRKRSQSPDKKHRPSYVQTRRPSDKQNGHGDVNFERERKQSPDEISPRSSRVSEYTTAYLRRIGASPNLKPDVSPTRVANVKKEKEHSEMTEYQSSFMRKSSTDKSETYTSRTSVSRSPSPEKRSPSPEDRYYKRRSSSIEKSYKRTPSPTERVYKRTPSPEWKRMRDELESDAKKSEYLNVYSNFKTKTTAKDIISSATSRKRVEQKPEWVTTNVLRKTNDRTCAPTKKAEEKVKTIKRSYSPSKVIMKPTDVITSSYGVGPVDDNGQPMFGLKALRKHSDTKKDFEVKGMTIHQQFRSENGEEPVGEVTVTAYSSNPKVDLKTMGISNTSNTSTRVTNKGGVTTVTKTTKYGGSSGNSVSKVYKQSPPKQIQQAPAPKKTTPTRQGSVKTLTEKFIKNTVEQAKTEKSSYPKAGLILRSSSIKDASEGVSSRSSSPGLLHSESDHSIGEEYQVTNTRFTTHTSAQQHPRLSGDATSFLDSSTKVSGVQDILTRMKNADIVVTEGDSNEDAEARALLNKFLGATVLMAGMEGHINNRGTHYKESKTVVTKSSKVSTNIDDIWDEGLLRQLLEDCSEYEERRRIRARLRQVMAEQEACAQIVAAATEEAGTKEQHSKENIKTVESRTTEKSTTVSNKVVENVAPKKTVSPFAKFRQLDKQNSTQSNPSTPKTPLSPGSGGSSPMFKFTDPQLQASAANIKERLLQWCRDKTQEYENVKLDNFSTSWSDGLAFCALIHHFLPDAYDYSKLVPTQRRHNFTLAFKVADEKAGIYPLLDVDDMVAMKKPDWKCVFTYVQAIHRRFKDQD